MSEQNVVGSGVTGGITGGSLPKPTAQQKFLAGKEEEYTEKYNGTGSYDGVVRQKLDIIPGSAVQDLTGQHEVYKNKVRLQLRCECGTVYERATSDLHTTLGCPSCTKLAQKSNKKAKKGRTEEAPAPAVSPEERLAALRAEMAALEAKMAGAAS